MPTFGAVPRNSGAGTGASSTALRMSPVVVSAPVAATADPGVTDPSRVYEKNGHPVVDTGQADANGHVPTHRLDQPTNRQPGETWEQYEARALGRRSFSPDTAAIRDIGALDPDVQAKTRALIAAAKQAGHSLDIGETRRTQERQEMLFQKGRSQPGDVATWTLTSDHTPGRAVDFVVNGDTTGRDPGYSWLQANAPKYGFSVMGQMDPGHVSAPTSSAANGNRQPSVSVGQVKGVGVPEDEVARLAGEGNIAANLTIGGAPQDVRERLQPIAARARDARTPLAARVASGLVDLTTAPIQRAVFSPVEGEPRPDPRLTKGGNSAGLSLDQIQQPYDAEHGAITERERTLSGAQAVANAALPAVGELVAGPVAKTALGRVAQMASRNAIAAAATNAPVEAVREAASAPSGERLAAAGRGFLRGAEVGGLSGALLGGAIGSVGEIAGARLASALPRTSPAAEMVSESATSIDGRPQPTLAQLGSVGVRPKGFGPKPAIQPREFSPPLSSLLDEARSGSYPTTDAARASVRPAPEDMAISNVARTAPEPPPTEELVPNGAEERFSGLGLPAKARQAVKTAYRSALVTPYAEIEDQAPGLADALMNAGAAPKRAQHIATRRLDRVMDGLEPWQRDQFGKQLVLDNVDAEAAKKSQQATDLRAEHAQASADDLRGKLEDEAYRLQRQVELMPGNQRKRYPLAQELSDFRDQIKQAKTKPALRALADERFAVPLEEAADRFTQHGDFLRNRVQPNLSNEPWFQQALGSYKTEIETPLRQAAFGSGVAPSSLRQPASAYVKLISEARAQDAEIRRALDIAGVKSEAELRRRPALIRKIVGENPALARYFATGAQGPRQGPLAASVGPQGFVPRAQASLITGSAKQAMGTAENYLTDLPRILETDAPEKVLKSARNQILVQVKKYGRALDPGEASRPGLKVLAFDDTKGLVTGESGTHRYEVTPEIHDAVTRYYRGLGKPSAAFRGIRGATDLATRAQISGMPVEATSHANTLASIIASVPGEKDVTGKVMAAVPAIGAKAAAVREMMGLDFSDAGTRALENRLADIGALRQDIDHGGIINSSHRWLFGPQGVDVRGRLVLARKLLARDPSASDAELREFITSKLGNYVPENAGALTNFMARGSVLSPFARFQSARIPTAVKATVGNSGLPALSARQKAIDVANTLYRGPVGHVAGAQALNYALTGHSTFDNEPGHALDVNTGLVATPGRIGRSRGDDKESPLYVPASTLSPLAYTGLRATGLRSTLFSPGTPTADRLADALRDEANIGLGTLGPAARFAMTATTGTTPYLQRDNTFMRVAPRDFSGNQEVGGQLAAALGLMNPAVHAFNQSGGDASRTLASSVAEDAKPMGGPLSFAAKVAEFMMPRVLSPGVGGRTNEQSVDAQLDRRYSETVRDIEQRIKRAPGPETVRGIIDEAARHAAAAGYDPDAVIVALEKAASKDQQAVTEKNDQSRQKRLDRIRQ